MMLIETEISLNNSNRQHLKKKKTFSQPKFSNGNNTSDNLKTVTVITNIPLFP